MSYRATCFLLSGRVPTLQDGNSRENIFNFPWKKHRPIVIGNYRENTLFPFSPNHKFIRHIHCIFKLMLTGPRFGEAFQDPNSYLAVKPIFEVCFLWRMNVKGSSRAHSTLASPCFFCGQIFLQPFSCIHACEFNVNFD